MVMQVPQFILDHMIEAGLGGQCNIICTQPRRIAVSRPLNFVSYSVKNCLPLFCKGVSVSLFICSKYNGPICLQFYGALMQFWAYYMLFRKKKHKALCQFLP